MTVDFVSLAVIIAVAAIAPILARLIPKRLVPEIVFLLFTGAMLGPHMLGVIVVNNEITLVSDLGLAFLFLFAGFEISPDNLTSKMGRRGLLTWAISFVVALGLVFGLDEITDLKIDVLAITIGLVTTALGTILPILQERQLIDTPVGNAVLSYGTWGELCPVIAMALLLGTRATWITMAILAAFVLIAVVVAVLGTKLRSTNNRIYAWLTEGAQTTSQTFVRLTVLVLVLLTAVSAIFDLDIVLGAFAAGFVLRHVLPKGNSALESKLQGIGYGFFIPVFFVVSGSSIDLIAVFSQPVMLIGFIILLLFVRGLPIFISLTMHSRRRVRDDPQARPMEERLIETEDGSGCLRFKHNDTVHSFNGRLSVALYCTTALPLIVAVTSVAVSSGTMSQDSASVLISAGAITVLLMPMFATISYSVADLHPIEALRQIKADPKSRKEIIRNHREIGRFTTEVRNSEIARGMSNDKSRKDFEEMLVGNIETMMISQSPAQAKAYMDDEYSRLSELFTSDRQERLAKEMACWYRMAEKKAEEDAKAAEVAQAAKDGS